MGPSPFHIMKNTKGWIPAFDQRKSLWDAGMTNI